MAVELLDIPESTEPLVSKPESQTGLADRSACSRQFRLHLCAAASCASFVLFLYWPTLGFDFVNWDDPWYIINNPLIKSWHPENLYKLATQIAIKNYAPVTMFSYLVDHTFWGLQPGGFHLTNLLLHAANAVLVYFLVIQLTKRPFIAWMTAALFAVHPIQIETVAWISSRKGLISATFILASLICWLRPNRTPKNEGYGLLFLACALLSKAVAVVVPAVVLVYDIFVRKQSFSTALERQIVPGFLAVLLLLVTMTAQGTNIGGMRGHMELSKLQILAVDVVILWEYIGMLIVPNNLSVLYDPPTSGIAGWVVLSAIGWLAVAALIYRFRKTFSLVALAALSAFVFLLPVLNLFPITTLMNDRYLYLPSIPLFALAAAGFLKLTQLASRNLRPASDAPSMTAGPNWVALLGSLLLVLSYCKMTHDHLPVWKDDISLWRHTAEHVPHLPVVQIQMAHSLHTAGFHDEAVAKLHAVLADYNPDELDRNRIQNTLEEWRK